MLWAEVALARLLKTKVRVCYCGESMLLNRARVAYGVAYWRGVAFTASRRGLIALMFDQESLRSECVIKLSKAIRHYNPERGRAFSCLTVAPTRFLFSYVTTIRTRVKRMSAVPDEVLEQYESNGQDRTELPEELKAKIQSVRTRFKTEPERGALKLLINYFLLEGFSQPRKFVLDTLGRQFELSLEKAASLYDYALVSLRSVLHEYYTPGLLAPSLCLPR